jgi:hypothetical protein
MTGMVRFLGPRYEVWGTRNKVQGTRDEGHCTLYTKTIWCKDGWPTQIFTKTSHIHSRQRLSKRSLIHSRQSPSKTGPINQLVASNQFDGQEQPVGFTLPPAESPACGRLRGQALPQFYIYLLNSVFSHSVFAPLVSLRWVNPFPLFALLSSPWSFPPLAHLGVATIWSLAKLEDAKRQGGSCGWQQEQAPVGFLEDMGARWGTTSGPQY